jgi:hypothetical protein
VLVALRRGQKKQEHLFQPCDRWQVQVKMLNGISLLFYDRFYWFYYVHHIIALATVSFPRHAAMLSYSRRTRGCLSVEGLKREASTAGSCEEDLQLSLQSGGFSY